MKRLAGYIATTILFCSACGGGNAAKTSATTTAAINFQEITIKPEAIENGIADTLKFGEMRSGEIIAKTIRVVNESDQPLVFTRHHVSCGCLSVKYDRKPIAKGASSDIELEFDSRTMMGLQLKTLVLYYAENARPMRIFVEAEVE